MKMTQSTAAVSKGKILFIPHDNRPTSCEQTAAVVKKLGYEVVMPDKKLLGGLGTTSDTEALWKWTTENVQGAKAAVIATDSLLYGGLVASRKHEIPAWQLQRRTSRLKELRAQNPSLKVYAFTSLMRTPRTGEASGGEDPDYFLQYGSQIFRYTALMDKTEIQGLTADESSELDELADEIPPEVLDDWLSRRQRNLTVTKALIDQVRHGTLDYLLIGKDDNAPLSQTHREARWLLSDGQDLPKSKFQLVAGIDEFAMLLLARAVNDDQQVVPKVNIQFNTGKGGNTVPTYSDERAVDTIREELLVSGATAVDQPELADYVLLVNTSPDGLTGEANHVQPGEGRLLNNGQDRFGTQYFLSKVRSMIQAGYRVGIADIAFTNGSDNALMNHLQQEGLLFRLRAYSGWNTATNSMGFALGQGMLSIRLRQADCQSLLLTRYLDDWAYQANVRTDMANKIAQMSDPSIYLYLGHYEPSMAAETATRLQRFAQLHLPAELLPAKLQVSFPWHRMFIADIQPADK
ncbi:MAG: DUF4127 family protein [Selenomonas sp.]|nr:DUF4127 family protein [Selenomonas sp.]